MFATLTVHKCVGAGGALVRFRENLQFKLFLDVRVLLQKLSALDILALQVLKSAGEGVVWVNWFHFIIWAVVTYIVFLSIVDDLHPVCQEAMLCNQVEVESLIHHLKY